MAITLYKYIDAQWLDNFFALGQVKIGTLFYYKDEENLGRIVGDKDEGVKNIVMESGDYLRIIPNSDTPEANFLKQVMPVVDSTNVEFIFKDFAWKAQYLSPNCYTFCASSKFAPDEMTGYGDSCYEILDAERYFGELNSALKLKRKVIYQGFNSITYCNRNFDYRNPGNFHQQ
jgi:hypothetical protein